MGHIGGFTPLEFLFVDMGCTKKSENARKKRDQLVKDVAEEVRAPAGCAAGDGTFGWLNAASPDLIEKSFALVHVELCRV